MGICQELYDRKVNALDFAISTITIHDKLKLSETEMNRLRFRELNVHGIPIEVLARANLFQNDMYLNPV